jgi:hypothetical protein
VDELLTDCAHLSSPLSTLGRLTSLFRRLAGTRSPAQEPDQFSVLGYPEVSTVQISLVAC